MSETPATLRLGLAAGGLRQARRHPLLAGRARRSRQSLMLLDTADRSLANAGWLCLSRDDGTSRRQEILPVAGQALTPPPALGEELQISAQGEAQFATVTLTGNLAGDAAGITVQFITKTLQHGGREATAEEILLHGPQDAAAAMTALAVSLAADLPLQWHGVPAATVAAADLGLVEPRPVRAGQLPFALPENASALTAFIAIARHCLAQFDANMLPVLRDRDTEGVHQMRVALRRLRSALHVFSPILPDEAVAPLVAELRWLNATLGAKRDLDVFLGETLVPLNGIEGAADGLRQLRDTVAERRTAAQTELAAALQSPRCAAWRLSFAKLLDDLPAIVAAQGGESGEEEMVRQALAPDGARSFAAAVLQKRRRKVKVLGRIHDQLDTEQLHELRIRAKRLRYAVEFFRPLFGRKDGRRFHAALTQLQDCLGALNDAAVGERLMREVLQVPMQDPAAAAITGWFAGRQRLQLDHLGACWDAFTRRKPFWKDALAD